MRKIKCGLGTFFSSIAVSAVLLVGLVGTVAAAPAPQLPAASGPSSARDQVCQGIFLAADPSGGTNSCGDQGAQLNKVLSVLINLFSLVIGLVAVIMIIVGGFKFITSGGDAGKVAAAKGTLVYALIGLVVVALAQVIVRFVLTNVPAK